MLNLALCFYLFLVVFVQLTFFLNLIFSKVQTVIIGSMFASYLSDSSINIGQNLMLLMNTF